MDPNHLRTLYQEGASMYLLSCRNSNISDSNCTTTTNKNNQSQFDPIQSARSLILNSIYNRSNNDDNNNSKHSTHVHHRSCIIADSEHMGNNKNHRMKKSNVIKTIPADLEDQEFDTMEQTLNELRKCQSQSTSIRKKAEIISSNFFKRYNNSNNDVKQNSSPLQKHMWKGSVGSRIGIGGNDERNVVNCEFYCPSCGLPYFTKIATTCTNHESDGNENVITNYSKIRLKPMKRGRTRRRRASRHIASKLVFDKDILQKHRGGSKTFSSPSPSSSSAYSHGSAVATVVETKVALKNIQAMRRIGDGMSKHCISYICSCGHEQSFKGFRPSNNSNLEGESVQTSVNTIATSATTPKHNKRKHRDSYPILNQTSDFLPLTPAANSKRASISTSNNLLLSNSSKKKRRAKQKKTPSKSGLHDFLSSLND